MSTTVAPASPRRAAAARPLGRWLSHYLSSRRRFLLAMGLALAVTTAGLVCLAWSLSDVYWLLPPQARWGGCAAAAGLLAAGTAAAIRAAARFTPLRGVQELEAMAPEHGQLLRTAFEEDVAPPAADTLRAALKAGLLDQAAEITGSLRPERRQPWPRLWRRWATAIAVAGAIGGLAASWPDFRTALGRFLRPGAGITFTQLRFVDPPREIIAGDEGSVRVQVSGREAAPPVLEVRAGDGPATTMPMEADPAAPRSYVLALGKPAASLVVRAAAGDGDTGPLTIPVIHPPKVEAVAATLAFPEYTGLPAAEQRSPDVEAIEGTTVTMAITTDRPLAAGAARFSDGSTAPLSISGTVATFTAPVPLGRGTWSLVAEDARGMRPADTGGAWVGREDRPPEVAWVAPRQDIEATPLAEVTLRARATDDFGLAEMGIVIQAAGQERTLVARSAPDGAELPLADVVEALAELEPLKLAITDNVKVYAFARDRFPTATGGSRRGVSDLLTIDIRPFKVWCQKADPAPPGGSPPPDSGQQQKQQKQQKQQLKQLEQLIKQQRGVVATVFRLKEQRSGPAEARAEAADRQATVAGDARDLLAAGGQQGWTAEDLVLFESAAGQMDDATAALRAPDLARAWDSADGALASLLWLRQELIKKMPPESQQQGQGQGDGESEESSDQSKPPSLAELAKEAERLAAMEDEIASSVPAASGAAARDTLAGLQADARADAGELFDAIEAHPDITPLVGEATGRADREIGRATDALRGRRGDEALVPLRSAADELRHLAQHLRGLDAAEAANTLQAAAALARRHAEELQDKQGGKDGQGGKKKEERAGSEQSGKDGQSDTNEQRGTEDQRAKNEQSAKNEESAKEGPSGKEGTRDRDGKSGAERPGDDTGRAEAEAAARDAAMMDDWLKRLAASDSQGPDARRLEALRRDAKTEDLARQLAELARDPAARGDTAKKDELAGRLAALAEALTGERDRMVQGTLEKLARAQKQADELAKSGGQGQQPGQSPGQSPGQQPGQQPGGVPGSSGPGPQQPGPQQPGPVRPGAMPEPGSAEFVQGFAELLQELDDPELGQLGEELLRELAEQGAAPHIDKETIERVRARLKTIIDGIVQRQLQAPKSDRVPREFEAMVENYFRRLSEDTGDEEDAK